MVGHRRFRKLACSLLLLLFMVALPVSSTAQDKSYVKYVIDGDTIILKNGQKVRFIGIDAPEIDHETKQTEPLGYTSRAFNKKLLGSKIVRLEYDREKQDHYNRILAYVFLPDNTFVNLELLRSGMATYLHKPPNLKFTEQLLQAQRTAMSEYKGVWHAWSETGQTYMGNRNSKRFHLPGCRYGKKTAHRNQVRLSSKWDAYWDGYSPCTKCLK
jgi:endonuclease YncB( thermonuclease family)